MSRKNHMKTNHKNPAGGELPAAPLFCPDCAGTGIVGDEGPGLRNARHEWVPCDCPKGDAHRPRRIDRFQPGWSDVEMDAISDMAKAKEMSQKAVVRAAVRLYQAVHAGACTVAWPYAHGNGQNARSAGARENNQPNETDGNSTN